jgi:hypothetical protein
MSSVRETAIASKPLNAWLFLGAGKFSARFE